MGIPLFLLFFLNLIVTIVVIFYQKAFLHVSAHFTIISCAIVSLFFSEKIKQKLPVYVMGIALGGICGGFLLFLFQTQWKRIGELVFVILNMVFPGTSWLKIFKVWLERLPLVTTGLVPEIIALIIFVNIVLGCFFLWAMIYLIDSKEKKIGESVLALAFINTLGVGRLYFPWPPLFWGTLIYFGGAVIVGWVCKERNVKKEELVWVTGLGNLPWWLIGIGLGYRILVDPQQLIDKAKELSVSPIGLPVALIIALLLLAIWALLNSFLQWLILIGINKGLAQQIKEKVKEQFYGTNEN